MSPLATARSGSPSPLKLPTPIHQGKSPVVMSVAAPKVPSPSPRNTETFVGVPVGDRQVEV